MVVVLMMVVVVMMVMAWWWGERCGVHSWGGGRVGGVRGLGVGWGCGEGVPSGGDGVGFPS